MSAQKVDFELKSPAATSSSIYVIWESQAAINSKVQDYAVFVNGEKLGESAFQQAQVSNVNTAVYKKAFYEYYTSKLTGLKKGMAKNDVTFYCVKALASGEELKAGTEYKIRVEAVDKKGKKIASSAEITVKTAPEALADGKKVILDVTDFGAEMSEKITTRPDDKIEESELSAQKALIKNNTAAIQKAIDSCPDYGTVYIPNGIFMSGQLNLKSNMTLKIDGVLCGSPFEEDYCTGFFMYKYYTDNRHWGLISADGAENITICGSGTVDGNGWLFADSEGSPTESWQVYSEEGDPDFSKITSNARQLIKYAKANKKTVHEYGILSASCAFSYLKSIGKTLETASDADFNNAYSTRSTMVILRNVKNLLIEDLMFINPSNHAINVIDSSNITVTGITEFTYNANNGDGIGLMCSRNAFIFNNLLDTGDDSIVFGSGVGKAATTTGETGVENVEVFGNYIHHGHGGVAFGSHTALGIQNVSVHDNVFNHTDAPFRIKSAPANGGFVKNVVFKNNAIAFANQPFIMSTEYNDAGTVSKYGAADRQAVFSDILCQDCTVYKVGATTIYISAVDETPHHDIHFKNVVFAKSGSMGRYIKNCDNFTFEK